MPTNDIERAARAMNHRQRVTFLNERGWTRQDSTGTQSWEHASLPGWATLACAVRVALEDENPPTGRPLLRAEIELRSAAAGLPVGMSPFACVGCHATEKRLAEEGHFGSCRMELRHRHRPHVPIKHCEHWLIYGPRIDQQSISQV